MQDRRAKRLILDEPPLAERREAFENISGQQFPSYEQNAAVPQFGELLYLLCHSEASRIGEESAFAGETADSSRDKATLPNDNS